MQNFSDKLAVITGGASGVGRSLAFALGRRGAKIAVGDVDKAAMAQVQADPLWWAPSATTIQQSNYTMEKI